jgi:hypothetical protein
MYLFPIFYHGKLVPGIDKIETIESIAKLVYGPYF